MRENQKEFIHLPTVEIKRSLFTLCLALMAFGYLHKQLFSVKTIALGIKRKERGIVAPVGDSVFNFDESGKVRMVCFKLETLPRQQNYPGQ